MSDPRARRRRSPRVERDGDQGFALMEYIISIAIMGLITAALAGAVLVVFRNQSSATERNDASNGSLGLTNYFPVDVAATPPGGRETTASLPSECTGYADAGFNVLRLTWSESLSSTTINYRVAYRLVDAPDGGELFRVSCDDAGGTYGAAKVAKVAFGLVHVPKTWTAGSSPAALAPLTGDGQLTLTLTTLVGTTYTVEGTRLNPAAHLDPSDPPAPAVAMETSMTLTIPNYSTAGQVLTYAVTISNTGAVPLVGVAPTYANAVPGTPCATVLASGVTTSCTATHTITQAELDAGSVTATVASVGYYSVFTAAAADVNTITAAAAPSLSAVLTTTSPGYGTDNELITYSMLVTNTGNITITDVTPSYSNSTATAACAPLPLAPGASTTCASTHNVTAGEYGSAVANVGTVTGTTTNFGTTAPTSTPALSVAFIPNPQLAVTDFTSAPSTYVAKDDVLTFSLVVSNTGNVDLTNFSVSYNRSLNNQVCPSSIARGTTVTCTGTETVEQEDVDRGSMTTRATVGAVYQPTNTNVSATATAISAAQGRPVISLLLQSGSSQYTTVGQVLSYTLEVTNVGTVTITGLTPTYTNATAATACAPLPLAPGATATCTASHTVTSAELGTNISVGASAVGATASNGNTSSTSASAVVVDFLPQPTISLVSVVASPSPFTAIGQSVTFTATVRNTGNVALSSVSVAWGNATVATTCATSLALGATTTCTGTHTATSTDSIAGFTTTATASASYAGSGLSTQASVTVPSSVPCTVVSPTSGGIASPSSIALVATNGPNKGFLTSDVVVTLNTSALCTGLRIKYFPQSPNSVIADLTKVSSGVWTYTIPGQTASAPATWKTGVKSVQILPAASVGNTAIYTNASAFTVT